MFSTTLLFVADKWISLTSGIGHYISKIKLLNFACFCLMLYYSPPCSSKNKQKTNKQKMHFDC